MTPSYFETPNHLTDEILRLVASISEKIGQINASHLVKPPAKLNKTNRIKSIQSLLEIEGSTLSEEQITDLIENRNIQAPQKDIIEFQNVIKVYDRLKQYDFLNINDLIKVHENLMHGLSDDVGKFRSKNVGIKASHLTQLAPSFEKVHDLMNHLFDYLKYDRDLILIKSCVFHYEFEFIHPFIHGNGKLSRLWQTLILMKQYPVFEYLPMEHVLRKYQQQYKNALSQSDKIGDIAPFIEFMLGAILETLENLLTSQNINLNVADRIELFRDRIGKPSFSRKDYLIVYKEISQPTASRDLRWAVDHHILEKLGDHRFTKYRYL